MSLPAAVRRVVGSGPRGTAKKAAGRGASVTLLLRTGLFDRSWYEAQAGRRFGTRPQAVLHYVQRGRFLGLSPCLLLEAEWYLPDRWGTALRDPLVHYLQVGQPAGASPHPLFDPLRWAERHPRAPAHRDGALGHFLATATPGTPLPAAVGAVGGRIPTWGEVLDDARARQRAWSRREQVRTAPRTSPDHDAAVDRAFVGRWSAPPASVEGGPAVTVVMPVRDRAVAVARAVASVRDQTTPAWQLVVVDDGSTDGTPEVLEALAREDPRIEVVRSAPAGVSAARNLGLARARGRYVAFLDSDNEWRPAFLQTAVAAMAGAGARAAYAVSEVHRDGGVSYRGLDAQVEHLAVRNHVDLNVLVLERSLLDEVGGFDTSLRRTVDYDLAWRVAQRVRLLHLPFVGVRYDDDRGAADRLSVRELRSWKDEVRRRHLVDWDALAAVARTPGRVSVVVVAQDGWRTAWRAVRSALAGDPDGGEDVEVVVVDPGHRPSTGRVLGALALREPRVRVLTAPDPVSTPLGLDLGLALTTGEHVLVLAHHAVLPDGALGRLRSSLGPGVRAAGPLTTDWRDLVAGGGWTFPRRAAPPVALLAEHPREDARRLGAVVDVPALAGDALLLRAEDLVRVRGADPLLVDEGWDVDLCLRLREVLGGSFVLRTDVEVVVGTRVAPRPRPLVPRPAREQQRTTDRGLLRQRWAGREPDVGDQLWRAAGLAVAHLAPVVDPPADDPAAPAAVRPVTVRPARHAAGGGPSLRWAIQTATPPGVGGRHWGDGYFAESLAGALRDLGQEVVVDGRAALGRRTARLDDVVLGLRGKIPLRPQPGAVNLLWVISHPDLVTTAEMAQYERVFGASRTWSAAATGRAGRPVVPLLQATDPSRFHPDAVVRGESHEVVFVGNSRGVDRPVVSGLLAAGVDVAVVGGGWEGRLPEGVLRATHVPNSELAGVYRGAGVVLNDHWEDMRREGFASNRLFDAAATGALVVSDRVVGVDDVFGGLVQWYDDVPGLVDLVRRGPRAFPSGARRWDAAERVRREHSFAARARVLLEAASAVRQGGPPALAG
ncbi:glycosyltransferase [Pseudokineococcus basanitobsidens]|uniref:Glycosyltransferase n=1 Tax=Pseudokineococcus basanitobsidens TaxID=1926649 RepID=A0ABU8RL87_9ACTN